MHSSEPARTSPVMPSGEKPQRGAAIALRLIQVTLSTAIVAFSASAWTFWVTVSDGTDTRRLSPGDVDIYYGGFVWSLVSIFGLLALPAVWSRAHKVLRLLAITLLFAVMGFALVVPEPYTATFGVGSRLNLVDGLTPHTLTVTRQPQPLPGYGATGAAAFVALIASFLMLRAIARSHIKVSNETSVTESRASKLRGAGAFTLGVVMLLASVFVVGWAADNCTASPLLVGSCTGLTFSGVEYYGIQAHTDLFDPIASLHAIPLFIVLGAGLILLALWAWRRVTPGLCLWITLWLAAVTFFVVVAVAGIGVVTEHSADLGLQAGTWKGQTGAYLAGAGLVVGWLALVSLWYAALRGGGEPVAAEQTVAGG